MKRSKLLLILFVLLAFGQTVWAQDPVSVSYVGANGEPQTAYAYLITSSSTTLGMQGYDICYYVQGNVEINSQVTYISNINLILCDNASLTINTTNQDAIHCSADNLTLTIYGQTNGTGQLTATATSSSGIYTEYFTINGGIINASGSSNGIYANKTLVINRGTVTANGNNWGMQGNVVTINGGNVTANGGGIWCSGMASTLTIGYTNSSDRIYSTKYKSGYTGNMMRVKSGQYMKTTDSNFIIYGYVNDDWKDAIAGHTLMPHTPMEWSGSGTELNPYIINSVDDLNLLSVRTNGGTHPYSDTCFKLGANITFTASSDWNDATSTESNFTAIGSFSGHFDGDVYTISGLRIRKNYGVGLFSYLADGAVVENITLSNSRVTGNADNTEIGGIVGNLQPDATVNNCHVTNTVYVYSNYFDGGVRGGVVGYNYGGTISNCVSEATIGRTAEQWNNIYDKAGGIVGVNDSGSLTGNLVIGANITCYTENYGTIAGNNENGTLTNNYYHACTANGTANTVNIGVNGADITTGDGACPVFTVSVPDGVTASATATVTHNTVNYYKEDVTITLNGGLEGTPAEGCQKAYVVYGKTLMGSNLSPGHEFDIQNANAVVTIGSMPADWATEQGAGNTEGNPYKIYYKEQLDLLATRVNAGNNYSGKYFKLMDDITYSYTGANENNYTTIGTNSNPFKGHFNGNHKTVNGIRIYGTDSYQGVFGYIVDAEVKDLYVNDIMISGHDRVGSIVGECDGSSAITNCRVTTATLTATGDSYNQQLFGGIAGRNSGTSTMSNNFVLGINIPQIYHFGAIAGENGGSLVSNYYHNYIMNGTAYPTGMGCNGGDVGGAEPVFTVSVPDGVTATATATASYNEVNYYKEGVTITLSGGLDGSTTNPGCQKAYVVYGNTLIGSNLAPGHEFNMQNANAMVIMVEVPADWAAEQGAGDTEGSPYKIYYKEQLELLATRVNAGESYSGKYFKLMDDLTYDKTKQNNYIAIGTNANPFSGHFDGNQKTINGIRINSTGEYLGVFGYIVNAEVKDLYVNDITITGHGRVGSIVGECDGGTTITNCRVTTATLNATDAYPSSPLFGGIAGRNSGSSTMSNNFAIGIDIPFAYHTGAIAGENGSSSQSLISNYYYNCSMDGIEKPTGIGCNGQDVEGAKPVFSLTLADDISADVTPVVTYNTVNYCVAGVTINLSYVTPANPGYRHIYSVNGTPIEGDSFVLSTNSEVTVAPNILINWETAYDGTEEDPYLISNVEQWDMLASNVSISGIPYSGEYFKLTENISVTSKVGYFSNSSNIYHPFSGTFDGNGHTLTYTYNVEPAYQDYISPFSYINGATIKNLHVTGLIKNQGGKYIGGIAGRAEGTNHITNCRSSVDLQADTPNSSYDVSTGGLLGEIRQGIVYFENCLFDGYIRGYNNASSPAVKWGGFVGWVAHGNSEHAYFTNCLFAPTQINLNSTSNSCTFARRDDSDDLTFTNCYYLSTLGTTQGLKARSISGGENVNVSIAGDAQEYSTSNITAYTSGNMNLIGLKYGNTLYAGKSESVSINLEFTGNLPAHNTPVYTATNATLNGTENPYTLILNSNSDAAVVISCDNTILVWEGHGTETDPYLIYTNGQWDLLATNVDNGTTYSSTFFKLMDDISVTTMVGASTTGSSYKSFNGTFDGNGHTLNVTYSGSGDCTAPFTCISGATIKNLHVTGTIATTKMRPASIASFVADNSTIENCWSEVAISSSHNSDIDAGGFVARVDKNKSVTLKGCLFTGSITYSDNNGYQGGGMVGWTQDGAYATLNNCYFAPSSVSFVKDSDLEMYMFIGGKRNHVILTNCYYNDVAAAQTKLTPEDKRAYSITGGSGVSVENAGNPTPYNVSGITSYGTGIKYNNVLYAGNGDNVSLNLEYSAGSGYTLSGFVASAGTLAGSSNPYTLEMPDANVTITVTTTVAEWEGTGDDWDHAYLIYNKEQLNLLASRVNAGNDYSNKYFKLMANLTYTGTNSNYTVIGNSNSHKFNGHFDGQGFTFSGIRTNYDQNVAKGLFGYLGSSGEVKNIVFSNSRISTGRPSGAIVGNNEGTITNCHVTSDATLFGTDITAYIIGGIVGANQSSGTISQCSFAGTIRRTSNHNEFSNNNYEYGGIVGGNYGNVTDNFVYGATIYEVPSGYSQGGDPYMTGCGAIFGHQHTGTIARNYYIGCTLVTNEQDYGWDYITIENATGVGSGGYIDFYDLTENDGAVPGNMRTISGYGDSEEIGWAFIASPLTATTTPTSVENLFSASEYDLYRLEPSNSMWENYKHSGDHYHFSLENGRGYLYATQEQETVKFIGATTSAYNLNDTKDVTLGEGFNLVGNPFPRATYVNKSYYKLNTDGSAVVADPVSYANYISPCNGVIVQGTANEVVTFSTTAPGSVGATPNNGNLNIALAQTTVTRSDADNKTIDNAIVSFNEGSELGKFYFGHQDANIYIPQGGDEYAIAFSDKHGEMPVNFKATENGSYTLTVNPESVEMAYLHLIDNKTGADVDLLTTPSYSFEGRITDYASRFKLVFVANDAQIGGEGSDDFAFISNGQLIITGLTNNSVLQIIDLTGRVLSSCNASNHISTDGLTAGVYVLRLIDGENVRTQKIVVK